MSIAARPPRRFDVPGPYPRLVGSLLDGETSDAELWRAHSQLILDAAGEGIYGLDVEGRSIFVNPAAARMTGHLVEELLGKSMDEPVGALDALTRGSLQEQLTRMCERTGHAQQAPTAAGGLAGVNVEGSGLPSFDSNKIKIGVAQ